MDRFVSQHWQEWARLDELVSRCRRSVRHLGDDELAELLSLYQRSSGHLSIARTQFDDPALTARLSRTLAGARGVIYRSRTSPGGGVSRFFSETFPAAAYSLRRQVLIAAILLFGPALALGFWMHANGDARDAAIDPATQELLAESEFADYYSSSPAESWTFELLTNNIQVSILAFGLGALGAVGSVGVLFVNGANLGVVAAVMHTQGQGPQFWGLILPHGLLELTAVCLAGGAGFAVAWAFIAPGDRSRLAAVADAGQRAGTLVLGTMVLFITAAIIEAFVTPSGLPTLVRVGIGVIVETLALTWLFGLGRVAADRGATGKMGEVVEASAGSRGATS